MIDQHLECAEGEDFIFGIRVFTDAYVEVVADAPVGATVVSIKPARRIITTGSVLFFGRLAVTLTDEVVPHAITMEVVALEAALKPTSVGRQAQNLATFTIIDWNAYDPDAEDQGETPVLTGTVEIVTPQEGWGIVTGANTLLARSYRWTSWRRDVGFNWLLAKGDLLVYVP